MKGLAIVPMFMVVAGYTIGSYGYVLIKGWDISFREWVSPLNPYQWPAKGSQPPLAAPQSVFPLGAKAKAKA